MDTMLPPMGAGPGFGYVDGRVVVGPPGTGALGVLPGSGGSKKPTARTERKGTIQQAFDAFKLEEEWGAGTGGLGGPVAGGYMAPPSPSPSTSQATAYQSHQGGTPAHASGRGSGTPTSALHHPLGGTAAPGNHHGHGNLQYNHHQQQVQPHLNSPRVAHPQHHASAAHGNHHNHHANHNHLSRQPSAAASYSQLSDPFDQLAMDFLLDDALSNMAVDPPTALTAMLASGGASALLGSNPLDLHGAVHGSGGTAGNGLQYDHAGQDPAFLTEFLSDMGLGVPQHPQQQQQYNGGVASPSLGSPRAMALARAGSGTAPGLHGAMQAQAGHMGPGVGVPAVPPKRTTKGPPTSRAAQQQPQLLQQLLQQQQQQGLGGRNSSSGGLASPRFEFGGSPPPAQRPPSAGGPGPSTRGAAASPTPMAHGPHPGHTITTPGPMPRAQPRSEAAAASPAAGAAGLHAGHASTAACKYAGALSSALASALGGAEPWAQNLATASRAGMSPRDAAASRVAAFHKGLSDALCTCLGHMGYSQAKARKAASGDTSDCDEIEARILRELLKHNARLASLFARATLGPCASPSTTSSAAVGLMEGGGDSGQYNGGGSKRACAHGAGPVGAAAKEREAGWYQALAVAGDAHAVLLEKYQKQLQASACQIWALMHILEPHPSREVKASLATYTNKTVKQVTDWFTNWRARHWKKIVRAIHQSPDAEGDE